MILSAFEDASSDTRKDKMDFSKSVVCSYKSYENSISQQISIIFGAFPPTFPPRCPNDTVLKFTPEAHGFILHTSKHANIEKRNRKNQLQSCYSNSTELSLVRFFPSLQLYTEINSSSVHAFPS